MTKAGEKMLAGAREALAVARGGVEMVERVLPSGVHVLSPASADALKRAAERGAAITARHTKRAS